MASLAPFGGATDVFDRYDEFEPANLPAPGPHLEDTDVLTGADHCAFHALTRELFEQRGVYDTTFGYNLARLNLDNRHTDAGFRYGVARDDPAVLHAEFTPTTAFCPQSRLLTIAAFRAWNGETDYHEYDLVSVRVAPLHHGSDTINDQLAWLEERFEETGHVDHEPPR